MLIKSCSGRIISTIEDWEKYSPPALKKRQWVDGRSAKELAKIWLNKGANQIPDELSLLFSSNLLLKNIEVNLAIPEYRTELDEYGKGRVHDLFLYGDIGKEDLVISIEAKVDEPFGRTISERKRNNPRNSYIHKRIAHLTQSLFYQKDIEHLRYQLLHGIAGTLMEAKRKNASFAVFIVHNFISPQINLTKYHKNTQDLNNFISFLRNKETILDYGNIIGPIYVPGGKDISRDIPIFIGKIKTSV